MKKQPQESQQHRRQQQQLASRSSVRQAGPQDLPDQQPGGGPTPSQQGGQIGHKGQRIQEQQPPARAARNDDA